MRKGLFVILLVLLTVSGAALAQEMPPVFCGDLNEADCALLQGAQTAMKDLTAASAAFNLDVQVEAEGMSLPFNLNGSATFSGLERMDYEVDMTDMTEMPDISPMLDALRNFNAELILNVTVPEDMAAGADFPNTIALELRLVDGVGYINFDPLAPILGQAELSGWGGLDLAGLIGALVEQITPEMLAQLGDMEAFGMDQADMTRFADPEFASKFMSVTRTDDGSGATATFEFSMDFAALYADPDFQAMMREQMQTQMEMQDQEMSEDEMQMALDMVSKMFENITMTITEEIDTATNLMVGVDFAMNMDMTAMMADMGESSDPLVVNVTGSVDYTYDDIPTIAVPEDAQVLPYEDLLMMVGSMMGEMGGMMMPPASGS